MNFHHHLFSLFLCQVVVILNFSQSEAENCTTLAVDECKEHCRQINFGTSSCAHKILPDPYYSLQKCSCRNSREDEIDRNPTLETDSHQVISPTCQGDSEVEDRSSPDDKDVAVTCDEDWSGHCGSLCTHWMYEEKSCNYFHGTKIYHCVCSFEDHHE